MIQPHLPTRFHLICLALFTSAGLFAQNVVLNFSGMTPHVGQKLEARLVDKSTLEEVARTSVDPIASADFTLTLTGETGKSYFVDFYADLNKNGIYDAPPTDHAWRLEADMLAAGDNMLSFDHNTNFTDIEWKHLLTFNFSDMTPHVGQRLEIRVRDINQTGREVGRRVLSAIASADFTVELPFLENGRSYFVDFYADLNQNGAYDAPPADHAWREMLSEVSGDTELTFAHNTNFMDIGTSDELTVRFTGMTPHVGQMLELRVTEMGSGKEIGRHRRMITVPDFDVSVPGIIPGNVYQVDFYADLNKNGTYDAPPMDHAWRETFTAAGGDVIEFSHNTSFTDIEWVYTMTLAATDMTPHLGQAFELRVIETGSDNEVGRFSMPSIMVPFFFVRVPGIEVGKNYNVDFYADLNQNGSYDAPPADHAWRLNFDDVNGDETLTFEHNTDFTDIQFSTGLNEIESLSGLSVFPNPFEHHFSVTVQLTTADHLRFQLTNLFGRPIQTLWEGDLPTGENALLFDEIGNLPPGMYLLHIQSRDGGTAIHRLIHP
ncbi:MAG: T9SS C-terminal target domain-containing protein [Bacteroidetes bacterium]|nr:MAG: T9SS C-terminal target domain-containing protein [Bacteroidota bacterium]